MIALLKSDRFGMESEVLVSEINKLIKDVKIRPFRYGKISRIITHIKNLLLLKSDRFGMERTIWASATIIQISKVKIRPFRYGKILVTNN